MEIEFEFNPLVWFVCKLCKRAFSDADKLKAHKLENHFGYCVNIKCIVFEEQLLDHEWIPPGNFPSEQNKHSLNSENENVLPILEGNLEFISNNFTIKVLNPDEGLTLLPPALNTPSSKKVVVGKKKKWVQESGLRRYNTRSRNLPERLATAETTSEKSSATVTNEDNNTHKHFSSKRQKLPLNKVAEIDHILPDQFFVSSKQEPFDDECTESTEQQSSAVLNATVVSTADDVELSLSQTPLALAYQHQNQQLSDSVQNFTLIPLIKQEFYSDSISEGQDQNEVEDSLNLANSKNEEFSPVIAYTVGNYNSEDQDSGLPKINESNIQIQVKEQTQKQKQNHNPEKSFMCQICFNFFRTNSDLRKHTRSHSDARPFACAYCPLAFKSKASLEGHLILHGRVTEFQCRFCGRSLAGKKDLLHHERTHTGERPFKCEVGNCNAAFHSKSAWTTHIRSKHVEELGLEQFICPNCGKTFGHQYTLSNHIRLRHSEDKPFKCPNQGCTMNFKIRKYLLRHLKQCNIGLGS